MSHRNDSRNDSHLQECLRIVGKGSGPCICWLLRACEQRMYEWSKSFGVGKTFYDAGRADALDAAREAVLGVSKHLHYECGQHALAAIDALREVDTPRQESNEHINVEKP